MTATATSSPLRFYLGTHRPHWLAMPEFADIPLFVSRRVLKGRKRPPVAVGRWVLDSGGYTELATRGRWEITIRGSILADAAGGILASADSMAWSYDARRNHPPLPGCTHKRCSNCPRYAIRWREQLLVPVLDQLRMEVPQ